MLFCCISGYARYASEPPDGIQIDVGISVFRDPVANKMLCRICDVLQRDLLCKGIPGGKSQQLGQQNTDGADLKDKLLSHTVQRVFSDAVLRTREIAACRLYYIFLSRTMIAGGISYQSNPRICSGF